MAPPNGSEAPQGTPRIVAYGDSIAVGIGSQPGVTAIATGGTGLRNNDLPSRAGIENGDQVIVSVGWNDTGFAAGNQSDYTQRVRAMIQDIKRENGGASIVLLGLEQGTGNDGGVYSGGTLISGERIRATNAALQAAAEAEGIEFLAPNTTSVSGARGTGTQETLHYDSVGYAAILAQATPKLQRTQTRSTPPPALDASAAGVTRVETETDADVAARNVSREQSLRDRYQNTDETVLREFFANIYNNEELGQNPFALLLLGVIGAMLGFDIGANRRAPETGDAVVAEAGDDGNVTTRVEAPDGTVEGPDRAPEYTARGNSTTPRTTPTFGTGTVFRAADLVPDMAEAARKAGVSESVIARAAARSAAALNTMHPQMRSAIAGQVSALFQDGHPVVITEGFRSFEEQNRLYAQGRTTRGDIVTHARGGDSYHNYGLACDIVPADRNGSPTWADRGGVNGTTFTTIRGYMRDAGVRTIGDWDKPHYEMPIPLRELRRLQRDSDGYPILPDERIPAQWRTANAAAGVGSSPTPASTTAPVTAVSATAANESASFAGIRISDDVLQVLNRIDGNHNHKFTQAELTADGASRSLIAKGVRDANGDGIIQLGEFNAYLQQFRQSLGNSRGLVTAVA